ncbi:branched-chain amino acid aminotransferase [Capsaspora owczarzaki ATCC 30864]|uniref:Branched-chain amino acid aminotransferase n=1 Tax=Capsaspora owczarzaki (strain ATCC 30864) TaxID=595528 RepID=A0A0D2WHT9_CAPO3|nr:branched-chain amino acid aminotransferase [Capsaspora owczarzaki ATCC 30864]KJE89250.1 branched-chain amino acid aminotransferase [Capsaspora owczarzaki ATCC 30864]|eukprot:XP_004365631.1 branched-chain amino acid aminotransferase [Capsaspora owczarzaki ATCC 30864]
MSRVPDKLGFDFVQTNGHVQYVWRNGKWSDDAELQASPYVRVHIAATALHYGQSVFEGLKAFRCRDGRVRVFRPDRNAARMAESAERLMMPVVPTDVFIAAIERCIRANADFIPSYEHGGSLYIRPILFGSGARVPPEPADEYTFIVYVVPVGDYYAGTSAVTALVVRDADRAAPLGVGHVKAAGNYAASMESTLSSKKKGYPLSLYLDPLHHKYIDEFSTSNFVAIDANGHYVTPESRTVLPSITNASLMQLCADMGIPVERRQIAIEEVARFAEVAACGTAVVLSPVNRIVTDADVISIGTLTIGPIMKRLYDRLKAIQRGDEPDPFGWMHVVPNV